MYGNYKTWDRFSSESVKFFEFSTRASVERGVSFDVIANEK